MSLLFSPLKIKQKVFKNRWVVSPMCMYSSVDGFATDFHTVHLGKFALGGFGLIIQEATAISPEGRITPYDLGIWKDEHKAQLQRVVDFVHAQDALIGIQLAHAGRKASHLPPHMHRKALHPSDAQGWQTVSATSIPYHETEHPPLFLKEEGINKVKADFLAATQRAEELGYDVLEIHAAHGYLLHQFLSPLSNQREDQYGGSFENRIRLLLEIVALVKTAWSAEKPLFVRISASDWTEDGWKVEDSISLAQKLKALGVDLIDVSSGGNYPVRIEVEPGYQVPFSAAIKQKAEIKTGTVGLITTAEQATEILESQKADLILLGRKALREPFFPLHAAREYNTEIKWPVQYERGKENY